MTLKNSELVKEIEELIKKYNKKPEKKIRKKDIIQLFQNAEIIIPCRIDYSESNVYEELFESVLIKPDVVKDGKSIRLLPVFTTYEQIPIEYMERFSLIRMKAQAAYDFMNESEDINGIVINPFTDANMELKKKSTAQKSATKSYVKQVQNQNSNSEQKAIIIHHNLKYTIAKSPFTIGRTGTDITIPESYISKIHAIISYKEGKYRIADYGSTNGTKLNGKQLKPKVYYELRDGYEIELSDKERLIIYIG